MRQPLSLLPALILLSVFSFAFAFSVGSISFSLSQINTALFSNHTSIAQTVIWEYLWPVC